MPALRWWTFLLVPGGFVVGHELGYQAAALLGAASPSAGGHAYLGLLVLAGVPFACATLARSFVAGVHDQLPPVRYRSLALTQVTLFLAVELAEHTATGLGPLAILGRPAILFGLAAQFLVAGLLTLIVRTSHDAGRAVAAATARRRWPPAARLMSRPAADRAPIVALWVSSVSNRGPPPAIAP